jgi:hypothetical protein
VRPLLLTLVLGWAAACGNNVVDDAGATDDAGVQPSADCPQSGGSMIEVPDMQGGSYCIDQTEVTNAAYAAWLGTNPSDDLRTRDCRSDGPICTSPDAWYRCDSQDSVAGPFFTYDPLPDASPVPEGTWPVPDREAAFPVVNVAWCDAEAFCKSNGKRLCGKVGGGAFDAPALSPSALGGIYGLDDDEAARDPRTSEIYNAATAAGTRRFPYGDTFRPDACPGAVPDGPDQIDGELHRVRTTLSCEGGFPGLFDLIGNALEYIDAVDLQDGQSPIVLAVGDVNADPDDANSVAVPFVRPDPKIGFRCCADATPP